ncbi:MAG TPA: GNAT family N-acetyltransferase [Opitutales bacterium]|nr:GNAT family N-acetyltransferase [Opitutales bacterium]
MNTALRYGPPESFSDDELSRMRGLIARTWPPIPGQAPREISPSASWERRMVAAVFDGDEVVAHAQSFARTIDAAGTRMVILALAGVCVEAACRGHGLGSAVVRANLARVDCGEFPLALYQTKVPGFYEQLGARITTSRIVNSLHPTDPGRPPFWEPFAIVYPAPARWPEPDVDLLGLGY